MLLILFLTKSHSWSRFLPLTLVFYVGSEGRDSFPSDNVNRLLLPVRYQADLLFTRWGPLLETGGINT